VTIAHISGATFDPAIEVGGNPALLQLFGATDAELSGLSDVELTGLATGDALIWNAGDARWENEALGSMAYQASNAVAITGGSITGMPTPTNPSDVATKAYADALPAGATVPDATMLANISGATNAPTPETLSDYLDYVFNTTVRGCIMSRSDSGWIALQPGGSGHAPSRRRREAMKFPEISLAVPGPKVHSRGTRQQEGNVYAQDDGFPPQEDTSPTAAGTRGVATGKKSSPARARGWEQGRNCAGRARARPMNWC